MRQDFDPDQIASPFGKSGGLAPMGAADPAEFNARIAVSSTYGTQTLRYWTIYDSNVQIGLGLRAQAYTPTLTYDRKPLR